MSASPLGRHCAVCPEAIAAEIRLRRVGRDATVLLRLCDTHARRAFRAMSQAVTADLKDKGDWAQRRLAADPALAEALRSSPERPDTRNGDEGGSNGTSPIELLPWDMEFGPDEA